MQGKRSWRLAAMRNEITQCEIPQDIWSAEAAKPRPASLSNGPESRLGIYAFQIANRIKELSDRQGQPPARPPVRNPLPG